MTATLSPDLNREQWLAARRKGIGASEIAAVLGISPWESPFSLFWRKVNGWDYEPSAQMEWGTRLEDAIAAKYADNHPDYEIGLGHLEQHPIHDWMLATPDRFIWDVRKSSLNVSGLLELKTAHSADGWGEPGTAEVPVYYRAQVLWQMAVVGVEWADIAVLVGGSDYREYQIPLDTRDLNVMVEAGRRFMARIESDDPPPLDDHTATLATVKRLHPDLDDDEANVDERVAANYLRACRAYKLAEKAKERYETLLRAQMGRAKRATAGGRRVATRTVSEIAETTITRAAHRRDYLTPAKEKP